MLSFLAIAANIGAFTFTVIFTCGAFSHFKNRCDKLHGKCHGFGTKKMVQKIESTAARYRRDENRREGCESGGTFPYSVPLGSLWGHPATLPTNGDAALCRDLSDRGY